MYKFLGWFNLAVILIVFLPIMLQKLNTKVLKIKSNKYTALLQGIRKLHRPLGMALFISVFAHGILALGSFRLHTGSLLGLILVFAGIFAIAFSVLKKKWLFVTHKILSYILVILMIVHLVYPSAIYFLLEI